MGLQDKQNDIISTDIYDLTNEIRQLKHSQIQIHKKIENKQRMLSRTIICAIVLFVGLFFIMNLDSVTANEPTITKGGFTIENLKGEIVSTKGIWKIPESEIIQVTIVDTDQLTPEKIKIIEDVIFSDKILEIDDFIHHEGTLGKTSLYHEGWLSALKSIQADTKFKIPTKFNVQSAPSSQGQIVIKLTTGTNPDGYSGFTKSIMDIENNQILKATITIYNSDKITNQQLSTIVRHEFGHALGLRHSSDPFDLMYQEIGTAFPYVSQCDIDALEKLYNEGKSQDHLCEV